MVCQVLPQKWVGVNDFGEDPSQNKIKQIARVNGSAKPYF
jgi:hypothetical protein